MGDSFLKFLMGDSVILNFDWKDWLKGVGVSIVGPSPQGALSC